MQGPHDITAAHKVSMYLGKVVVLSKQWIIYVAFLTADCTPCSFRAEMKEEENNFGKKNGIYSRLRQFLIRF